MDAATLETKPVKSKEEKRAEFKARMAARPQYPRPDGGLTVVGADYSMKFQTLGPKDFAALKYYHIFKADQLEKSAAKYRKMAENPEAAQKNSKTAKKAAKLLKLQKDFAELKAQLAGENVDVDAILATLNS